MIILRNVVTKSLTNYQLLIFIFYHEVFSTNDWIMAGKNLCAKNFYFPLNYITLKMRNNLSHVQYSAINKQQFYGTNSCIHCSKYQFMKKSYQISFCNNIIDPNLKKICNNQNLKQNVKKDQEIIPFLFKCDYLPIIEMETLPCLSSKSNLQPFDVFKCSLFCKNLSKADQASKFFFIIFIYKLDIIFWFHFFNTQ